MKGRPKRLSGVSVFEQGYTQALKDQFPMKKVVNSNNAIYARTGSVMLICFILGYLRFSAVFPAVIISVSCFETHSNILF